MVFFWSFMFHIWIDKLCQLGGFAEGILWEDVEQSLSCSCPDLSSGSYQVKEAELLDEAIGGSG